MTSTKNPFEEAAAPSASQNDGRTYERSSIEFPYLDLDTAVEVATALYQRAGLGSCDLDELAAEMGQTLSGAFRLKTSTSRMFGFIEKDGRAAYKLAPLGQEVVNDETEMTARAAAFLNVGLYSLIFDKYRGHLLPPAKALEREMAGFGVSPKQTDKARQAFERSARQAGFNAQGDDRLVQPRFNRPQPAQTESVAPTPPSLPIDRESIGAGDGLEKPLKYQLIDLLDPSTMSEEEQQAVWLLINYLARMNKPTLKPKAASENSSDAA